mgnify:CR=1 FL=1
MRYTVMAQRIQTTVGAGRGGFPGTEWTSSVSLPQFDIQADHINDAIYKAGWILDTRRDATTKHSFTVTDGNGNVWDENGRKL